MNLTHEVTLTNRLLLLAAVLTFTACAKDDDPIEDVDDVLETWIQIESNLNEYDEVRNMQFITDDIGYAQIIAFDGYGYKLAKTKDGGSSWSDVIFGEGQTEGAINDFSFQNENVGYAIGAIDDQQVRKTTDGGKNWEKMDLDMGYPSNLIATRAGTVYFVVTTDMGRRKLYTTDDGFQTSSHLYDLPERSFCEYKCLSADDAAFFALNGDGEDSYLLRAFNSEATILHTPRPDPEINGSVYITALHFRDLDAGYFAHSYSTDQGARDVLYTTSDFESYEALADIPKGTAGAECLYFTAVEEGWVGTGNGQIYKVEGPNLTLDFQNLGENSVASFSRAYDGNRLFFGGSYGTFGKFVYP